MSILLIAHQNDQPIRQTWLLPGQSMTVGRTEYSDFAFGGDFKMSSVHFVITYDNSVCRLDDLDSTNGTFVNDQPISQEVIKNGDTIRAGMTKFTIEHHARRLPDGMTSPTYAEPSRGKTSEHIVANSADSPNPDPLDRSTGVVEARQEERISFRDDIGERQPSSGAKMPEGSIQSPVGVCLELTSEAEGRNAWLLPGQQLTVGRASSSDFAVTTDATLSCRHFVVRCEPDVTYITDTNSTNGTFLNGDRVSSARIFDGDVIQAGAMRFLVHAKPSPEVDKAERSDDSALPCGISKETLESGLIIYQGEKRLKAIDIALRLAEGSRPFLIQSPTATRQIANPIYLYDWVPRRCAAQMSPVLLSDPDENAMISQLFEMWGTDSVSCVFSDLDTTTLLSRLRLAVRGQYRENVIPNQKFILTDARPSALLTYLRQVDSCFVQYLFGAVNALLLQDESNGSWCVMTLDKHRVESCLQDDQA